MNKTYKQSKTQKYNIKWIVQGTGWYIEYVSYVNLKHLSIFIGRYMWVQKYLRTKTKMSCRMHPQMMTVIDQVEGDIWGSCQADSERVDTKVCG